MRANSTNLDLLRAVAVITVMIDHLMPTLVHHGVHPPIGLQLFFEHVGHAGVLAFFVHTSLVLMYSLERLASDGRALAIRFYVRRFFRIYPLAIVCVIGVLVLGMPDSTWRAPVHPSWQEIAANLLLVQNLWTGHSVLVPLWSLPYEVEMYLVLPAVYLLARRARGVEWTSALLLASCIGAYGFRKLEHGHMNMAAYVPCFLAGVLCYAARDRWRPVLPGWLWAPFVVGLIALYCYAQLVAWQNIYWMGWSFCLVLAPAIVLFRDSDAPLLDGLANKIATYSYGLYLLHVPALYVVYVLWQPPSAPLGIAAFFALAAALAVAAYHLVEAPMVTLGRRLTTRAAT